MNNLNQGNILQKVYLFKKDGIVQLEDKTFQGLGYELIKGHVKGFFIESHHMLESRTRSEVIDLNQLVMYNALYLKVNQQLKSLLSVDNYNVFKENYGKFDIRDFDNKRKEFLENITQQVIVAELFSLTIRDISDNERAQKERKIQGFVDQIFSHMDSRVFEIIYMQDESYHMEWISSISAIISKYYYLSEIIEGMGIPLFEVIENAQKENQKIILKEMFPGEDETALIGRLADIETRNSVINKLAEKNIFIRCAWFIDENWSFNGNEATVVRIAVTNRGQMDDEMKENVRKKTSLSVEDKSLDYFFSNYSERSLSAGIGLPMVSFLVDEFKQKGIEVKFSLSNATQRDHIIAEMRFVI